MEEWTQWLTSENGVIFAIALVIFIVTIVLIIKRFVSFIVTVILLVLCVGSAYFLINPSKFYEYINSKEGTEKMQELENLKGTLKQNVNKALNNFQDSDDNQDAPTQ